MTLEMLPGETLLLVWLTKADQEDPAVLAALPALYARCSEEKTKVVLLKSGGGELLAQTRDLLSRQSRIQASQGTAQA